MGASIAFAALYLAAGAPTPLLVLYQSEWGFPAWVLTVAFAAYAISLLTTLLVVGSLSDYLGRRPVLIGSLALEVLAMVLFLFAPDIDWVIAARLVQGVATGAATSAFTAAIVELAPVNRKQLGAVIGGSVPAGGLGLGALLTGLAVQFNPDANRLVFTVLAVSMTLGVVVAILSVETVTRRAGAIRSLIPRITIPRLARKEFASSIPVLVAAWMLAGLFLGLVPTIILHIFNIDSGLIDGLTAFVEPGSAAAAGFVLGRLTPRRTIVIGGLSVVLGTAAIVVGVAAGVYVLLLLGGVVGGVGFGASFSGVIRATAPLTESHQRAGLFAGIYTVAYLAFGGPAIIAGLLVAPLGLLPTIVAYALVIVIVGAAGVVAQAHLVRTLTR